VIFGPETTTKREMEYRSERLSLKAASTDDLEALRAYLLRNRAFLEEWEPLREDSYYSEEALRRMLETDIAEAARGSALRLHLRPRDGDRIIGTIGLSNIVRGAFQSCFLGYKLDEGEINKGYMTEALGKVIEVAFSDFGLHRIEANVMPKNARSIRILEKLGFEKEGMSPKYLRIAGKWEDHYHYVRRNAALE